MKICIYGAGAIGGYLGAELCRVPDVEVSLIARGPHLDAIKKHGIKLIIDGKEQISNPTATDDPTKLGYQDYIFVSLKSHQAWESADNLIPLLGKNTAVITCQNGVP